jgi:hypothetical protein
LNFINFGTLQHLFSLLKVNKPFAVAMVAHNYYIVVQNCGTETLVKVSENDERHTTCFFSIAIASETLFMSQFHDETVTYITYGAA